MGVGHMSDAGVLCVSVFVSNFTIQRQHFPNDDDQTGAAKALTRLLDTYRLDADSISSGRLPGQGRGVSLCVFPW